MFGAYNEERLRRKINNMNSVKTTIQDLQIIKRPGTDTTEIEEANGVVWLRYKILKHIPWINHAFSTRTGGVSPLPYGNMNLSFNVGDADNNVRENFRLFGEAVGIPAEKMVYSDQVHSTNVLCVSSKEKGMGIIRDRDFSDIDGLITDEAGVCLVTSHADCVPVYFVDTKKRVIALSHAGWKGTLGNICKNTVNAMKEQYGTDPADITACIGPSISSECYEVGPDVADKFKNSFSKDQIGIILFPSKDNEDKYLLDLAEANRIQMTDCGIPFNQIHMPDLCTSCNTSWLHSHRKTGGKRGGMCAFLMITDQ